LVGATGQLALLILVAGLLDRHAGPPARSTAPPPRRDAPPAAHPFQTPVADPPRAYIWWVTEQLTAHGAAVVKVETERLHQARAIARQLIEPVSDRYVEALVYFYPPGGSGGVARTRVQWTRATGYVELRLDGE
jgi:hypothetical protein